MPAASRYRVGKLIKRGGVAEVFEAFVVGERGFERRVALKRLLPRHASDDGFVRAFIDEARIVSQLHHAGIVSVFDFGVLDDEPFLVSEWVDGVDLAVLAELAREHGARMPPEIALRIATEVAYALAYAHEARDFEGRLMNIVHRDVSPENVLVSWEGDIKLADFGIARAIRRLEETRVGVTKGKLGFMAPEQIRGQDVDARTDVFALGCVLHWLLTGQSAFEPLDRAAPSLADARRISEGLPSDVRALIDRATRPAPHERYASAAELAAACGKAMHARLDVDARKATRDFLAPLRPAAAAPIERPRAGDLLELNLVDGDTGPSRRFSSTTIEAPLFTSAEATDIAPIRELLAERAATVTITGAPKRGTRNRRMQLLSGAAGVGVLLAVVLLSGKIARQGEESSTAQPHVVDAALTVDAAVSPARVLEREAAIAEPPLLPSQPTPAEAPREYPKLAALEGELRAVLARRGLAAADLFELDETRELARELDRAKKAKDVARANKAAAKLVLEAGRVPISLRVVREKLDRLERTLGEVNSGIARAEAEKLFAEYLELRSRARVGATPAEYEALAVRARALWQRIDAARRRSR